MIAREAQCENIAPAGANHSSERASGGVMPRPTPSCQGARAGSPAHRSPEAPWRRSAGNKPTQRRKHPTPPQATQGDARPRSQSGFVRRGVKAETQVSRQADAYPIDFQGARQLLTQRDNSQTGGPPRIPRGKPVRISGEWLHNPRPTLKRNRERRKEEMHFHRRQLR